MKTKDGKPEAVKIETVKIESVKAKTQNHTHPGRLSGYTITLYSVKLVITGVIKNIILNSAE